jgi:hypothetical protein
VTLAQEKPSEDGDHVDDVSATHPDSLEVRSGPKVLHVEVGGATGTEGQCCSQPYLPTDQSIHKLSHFGLDTVGECVRPPVPRSVTSAMVPAAGLQATRQDGRH